MIDKDRIRTLVQFILLTASEQELPHRRALGEIHLLKYIYIADLAHAEWHQGATFTGGDWMFYKFGPWSGSVYAIILACLAEINADKTSIQSQFGAEDYTRWSLDFDSDYYHRIKLNLPLDVKQSISNAVNRHANDTAALLEAVYASEPMLKAAPMEPLDFSALKPPQNYSKAEVSIPFIDRLSKPQKVQFLQRKQEAASRLAKHLTQVTTPPSITSPGHPQYEEIVRWLDSMVGPELPQGTEIHFSASVWKSASRRGTEQ